jgi:hypothetical protein
LWPRCVHSPAACDLATDGHTGQAWWRGAREGQEGTNKNGKKLDLYVKVRTKPLQHFEGQDQGPRGVRGPGVGGQLSESRNRNSLHRKNMRTCKIEGSICIEKERRSPARRLRKERTLN